MSHPEKLGLRKTRILERTCVRFLQRSAQIYRESKMIIHGGIAAKPGCRPRTLMSTFGVT